MNLGDDANRLAAEARARVLIDRQLTDAGWGRSELRADVPLPRPIGWVERANGRARGPEMHLPNGHIEPHPAKFLADSVRTQGAYTPLTCGFAPIQTLKRNSTTSPSAIT